jgi:hypothetical protein
MAYSEIIRCRNISQMSLQSRSALMRRITRPREGPRETGPLVPWLKARPPTSTTAQLEGRGYPGATT